MIKEVKRETYDNFDYMTNGRKQKIYYNAKRKKNIRIVFVMGKTSICGGAKIIFQHANLLLDEGFSVSIVAHYPKPTWYPVKVNYIQVPVKMRLSTCIPDCDIIVATYYSQIQDCIDTGIAPVVYFEQGDVHIYRYDDYDDKVKDYISMQFKLPSFILTVSKQLAKEINRLFHKKAEVIHNAIDNEFNHVENKSTHYDEDYILMMGSDGIYFKGIKDIITAYEIVKKEYKDLKLYWITPEVEDKSLEQRVSKIYLAPKQEKIADLYRNAQMFISGSKYESFSLPVIEAMACGCPVITVDNLGIKEYAEDNCNAIIVPPHDPDSIAEKIVYLLKNEEIKQEIVDNGVQTIGIFRWHTTSEQLITYYKSLSQYKLHVTNSINDWNLLVDKNDFNHSEDYIKFMKTLLWTDASNIHIVRLYELDGVTIGCWELGAHKVNSENDKTYYCYVTLRGKENKRWLKAFYDELTMDKMIEVYKKCKTHVDHQYVIDDYRLTAYHLIKCGVYNEAKLFLELGINKWQSCTDLYVLYAIVLSRLGYLDDLSNILDTLYVMGEYAIEKYFIYGIHSIVKKIKGGVAIIEDKFVEEGNRASKDIYYFADKLFEYGLYNDSILYYQQVIHDQIVDINHTIAAYRRIALSHYLMNDNEKCRSNCFKAFQIGRPRAEECYLIGLTFQGEKKWEEAIFWYNLAIQCELPDPPSPFTQEDDWGYNPYLQLCLCYYEKGDIEKASEYNEMAAKYKPEDETVKINREFFKNMVLERDKGEEEEA